jgi:hypothetical protein
MYYKRIYIQQMNQTKKNTEIDEEKKTEQFQQIEHKRQTKKKDSFSFCFFFWLLNRKKKWNRK